MDEMDLTNASLTPKWLRWGPVTLS